MPHPLLRRAWLVAWCLLCACGLGLGRAEESPASAKRRWRAGVELNAAPFTFADEHGKPGGYSVELLAAVAAERGLDVEFVALPWSEMLPKFRAGEIDIICNIVDTPERRGFIAFSTTTATLHGALFLRKDHAPLYDYSDINGLRIAVPRDSRAHDFLKRSVWRIDFAFEPSLLDCITALNEGRADGVFSTDLVAADIMRRRGFTNIVRSKLDFPDLDYREHFGVSPANTALLAELNEGLLAVQRTGHYDRLYERWIGPLRPRELGWRDVRPYAIPFLLSLALILLAFA